MRERNPRHIALGIIGLLGVLLYVLACGSPPAWSPDSSKVLFPYSNPETKEEGIALYDRNTGTVQPVFSCKHGRDKCSDSLLSAAWSDDGLRAIVVWGESKKKKWKNPTTGKKENFDITLGHVEVFPVEGAGEKFHINLHHFLLDDSIFNLPLVEAEGKLYLSGEGKRSLLQLDLKTGKQKFRTLEGGREEPGLYSHEGHIFYFRYVAEIKDDVEFGEVDTKDLSLHSWFVLKEKSLATQGVSGLAGFFGFEPHGDRLALPAVGTDKKARILMCNRRGLEQILKPELPNPASRLANLEWARDGRTLYATVVTSTEKKGIVQYSLGEIPLAGGPVRLTPMVRARDSFDALFQISISPDGSTIAASTAYFEKGKIDPVDRGLFLVDLRDPERRVTRIQYPPVTGKKRTAGE